MCSSDLLFGAGVSHAGHVGGLLGGVLAASLVGAESFVPASRVATRRTANLRLAALLAAAPMLLGPVAARLAPMLALPEESVAVPNAGATLRLPWRMAENPTTILGLPAWVVSPNHDEPLFCGLVRSTDPSVMTPETMGTEWSRALGGVATPLPAPEPFQEGWGSRAWKVGDARVVQYQLVRGEWVFLAGYVLTEDGAGREILYQHALEGLEVGDPPALGEARRQAGLYPTDPARTWSLARELDRAGRYEEADPIWLGLTLRTDGWRAEAARGRILGWVAAEAPGVTGDEPGRLAWVMGAVAADPTHAGLREAATGWLVAHGRCAEAAQLTPESAAECRGSFGG